jgi:hypothetical protein
MRLARSRDAEAREEAHGGGLLDAGVVLRQVVEDKRLQAEELLAARIAIEVNAETGLGAAARTQTT